jgi:predicted dehydrogenase
LLSELPLDKTRKPLRLGVVGCGAVAERYHVPALLASPDVELVAFVDPELERARALAIRASAPLALSSHRDLPGKVDLAVLALPNALHAPVAVDLLTAGVHVLVEKPMARSLDECDRMLRAASATGAVLAVGHDFRHYPIARFAYDLFADGLLGAVLGVDIQQSAGSRWPAVSTAALSPEAGGGVLIDFGVHLLDLLLWWFGDAQVLAYRDDASGGVETECECELELGECVPIHVELGRTRAMRDTIIVRCERGAVDLGVFEPAIVRFSLRAGASPLIGDLPDDDFQRAPMGYFPRRYVLIAEDEVLRSLLLATREGVRRCVAVGALPRGWISTVVGRLNHVAHRLGGAAQFLVNLMGASAPSAGQENLAAAEGESVGRAQGRLQRRSQASTRLGAKLG